MKAETRAQLEVYLPTLKPLLYSQFALDPEEIEPEYQEWTYDNEVSQGKGCVLLQAIWQSFLNNETPEQFLERCRLVPEIVEAFGL